MNHHSYDDNEEKRGLPALFERFRREREGVPDDEPKVLDNPTIGNLFKLMGRKVNTLFSINLLYVFGNFPIFFALFALTGYISEISYSPYYQQFIPLLGSSYFDSSPVMAALMGTFGMHAEVSVPNTLTYIFYGLGLLVLLTFGAVNVGTTYLLRSVVREEPIFMWSDFWYSIKKNVKQEIVFGIIDLGIMGLLVYDFIYFYLNLSAGTMMYILFFLTFAMCIVYAMMRMYIYLMMITFDLSIFKLLKNALFFSILGIKRNIMALLGILILLALEYVFRVVFFPIFVIIPFICLFSVGHLICAYAAYPKIKEIMIDPYYEKKNGSEE